MFTEFSIRKTFLQTSYQQLFYILENFYQNQIFYLIDNQFEEELCFSHGDTSLPNVFGLNEVYSTRITSGGIYTGLKEISYVYQDKWKGKNGKWNDLSWGGNKHTGPRKIAKRTLGIVTQNIVFFILVKAIVLTLSAFGYAPMWLAIFADVGVTIIEILNSTRAMRFKK